MQVVWAYFFTLASFVMLDAVWLGIIARDFYKSNLGYIMGPVNWTAAVVFYLLFLVGVNYFALWPAIKSNSTQLALLNGAFFGFICYATYDLTNLATLDKWPLNVVIIDMLWGAVLGALVTLIGFKIMQTWFM